MSRSIHNLLQFALILESGKRRQPWERKALVSKPFPFVVQENCSLIIPQAIKAFEYPFFEEAGASILPQVVDCIIEDFDPFVYYVDMDATSLILPAVTACVIETADPFVRKSFDDNVEMLIAQVVSVNINDARIDYEFDDSVDMLIPAVTACVINDI